MSLTHLRCGVRAVAGTVGVASLITGGYALSNGHANFADVMEGLTFILLVAGVWVLVEGVVGGFIRLEARQASACAVAAQTVLAMTQQQDDTADAEGVAGVNGAKVRHLYR